MVAGSMSSSSWCSVRIVMTVESRGGNEGGSTQFSFLEVFLAGVARVE